MQIYEHINRIIRNIYTYIETFVFAAIDPDGYLSRLHSFCATAVRSLVWFIGGVSTLTHTRARTGGRSGCFISLLAG